MERSGCIAPDQSGGTGVGFDPPESLLYDEPKLYLPLAKCIVKRAQKRGRDYVTDGAKEIFGTWQDALSRRLFLLHTIRKRQETLKKFSGTKSDIKDQLKSMTLMKFSKRHRRHKVLIHAQVDGLQGPSNRFHRPIMRFEPMTLLQSSSSFRRCQQQLTISRSIGVLLPNVVRQSS